MAAATAEIVARASLRGRQPTWPRPRSLRSGGKSHVGLMICANRADAESCGTRRQNDLIQNHRVSRELCGPSSFELSPSATDESGCGKLRRSPSWVAGHCGVKPPLDTASRSGCSDLVGRSQSAKTHSCGGGASLPVASRALIAGGCRPAWSRRSLSPVTITSAFADRASASRDSRRCCRATPARD